MQILIPASIALLIAAGEVSAASWETSSLRTANGQLVNPA